MKKWKGYALILGKDGRWRILGPHLQIVVGAFDSLKEAFGYVNKHAEKPYCLWDSIKDAVRWYRNRDRIRSGIYMGDDDRGIDNEMRFDAECDGIHDFLQECKCLHLIYPTYYDCRDCEIA